MAFCPNCGKAVDVYSERCPSCNSRVPTDPHFRIAQPTAQAAYASPPFNRPAGAFMPPGFVAPRVALRRETLRIVLLTFAATVTVCIGIASTFVHRAAEVSENIKLSVENVHKALENAEVIYEIEGVAQTNTSLIQLLNSSSNQLTGQLDDRLDRKAQLIREYVRITGDVDTKHCPGTFVDAYKRYLSQWSDLAQVYASHPHIPSEEEAFVTRLLQNISGDFSSGAVERQEITEWAQRLQEANKQVSQGARDFADESKAAIDSVGKDVNEGKRIDGK